MLPDQRKDKIIKLLRNQQVLSVRQLSSELQVSEMTVRRDLIELDRKGVIQRVHGGATIIEAQQMNDDRVPFTMREVHYKEEKERIAVYTASLIQDGESIIIDTGTTAYMVSKYLKDMRNLFVITNSISVALELAECAGIKVLLLGGYIHDNHELSMVGLPAIQMLKRFRVDKAIMGAAGLHEERGLVYVDMEEAAIRKTMIECARQVIVATDHSKMGRDSVVAAAALQDIDMVISDTKVSKQHKKMLERYGIEIILV